MSAKDNFAQAMKELLDGDTDTNAKEGEDKKAAPSSFSSFSQPDARPPRAPAPDKKESIFGGAPAADEAEEEKPAGSIFGGAPSANESTEAADEEPAAEAEAATPAEEPVAAPVAAPAVAPAAAPTAATGDVTVVAPGTVIVGDISTAGGLRVEGEIKGNLNVASTLELTGKIIGDIKAADAVITKSLIKGNVAVKNFVTIDGETTVVGDVSGRTSQVNGKVKGNLTVEERAHFEPRATLVGNLIAGTVIIDEGAMLKGDIAITNAQNENINVEEPDFDIDL